MRSFASIVILTGTAFLSCQALRPQTADQPPVVVHQVNAEFPAELAASFMIDTVEVKMGIDSEGLPFALNAMAPLPDYVVQALEQWRFQPGKQAGKAVPFTISLYVPVRRRIDRLLEMSLHRHSSSQSKELKEAIQTGEALDAAGAAQLESSLATGPASPDARAMLLAYLVKAAKTATPSGAEEIRAARVKQIASLVENSPEAEILDTPLGLIDATADPPGYRQVRDLWLRQLAQDSPKPAVLGNAVNFLRGADPEKCEIPLVQAAAKSRNAAIWLGDLYGLALLDLPDTPFARKARAALKTTQDARILLSSLATVTGEGHSLAKAGHLPEGYPALCQDLLGWAKQLYPATSASCDVSAPPESEEHKPLTLRVGGNMQQAKLIRHERPTYPALARQRHITGTIRYQAIIDKQGDIRDLEFLRGPLIFYKTTRKTLFAWKYKPTLLNGDPVEVITQIDVNYELSH